MAKIDEVKEILNTPRVALSIIIGIIVVLIGNICMFYIDVFVLMIVNKISKKTKEIKDL
ncbi:MAG: hypothetical protein GXP61_10985 [Epsilonproteobacteria bacterium]|nr:hypothetical protein [Campylobacterota bacterium]